MMQDIYFGNMTVYLCMQSQCGPSILESCQYDTY